jgi:hypothetical protein
MLCLSAGRRGGEMKGDDLLLVLWVWYAVALPLTLILWWLFRSWWVIPIGIVAAPVIFVASVLLWDMN